MHHAEGLREVVDDAVQQDFLFLDFAGQAFVVEQGVAGGLQHFDLLVKLQVRTEDGQDALAIQKQRAGLQRNFAAAGRPFDPGFRLAGSEAGCFPEGFGFQQKVFEKGANLGKRNGTQRYAPQVCEPSGELGDGHECASAVVLEQRKAHLREEVFKYAGHIHPSIFRASKQKASSTPSPVLALERSVFHPLSASCASTAESTSQSCKRSHLLSAKTKGIAPTSSRTRCSRLKALSMVALRVPSATSR